MSRRGASNAMQQICPACAADPDTHSFKRLKEKNGVTLFYTRPANATQYKDTEGILAHVDNAIASLEGKKWICIIDGEDFDIRHATEISTGYGIYELLTTKYGASLVELKIINPTWHINGVIKAIKSWASQDFIDKLTVLDDRQYSVLQFL